MTSRPKPSNCNLHAHTHNPAGSFSPGSPTPAPTFNPNSPASIPTPVPRSAGSNPSYPNYPSFSTPCVAITGVQIHSDPVSANPGVRELNYGSAPIIQDRSSQCYAWTDCMFWLHAYTDCLLWTPAPTGDQLDVNPDWYGDFTGGYRCNPGVRYDQGGSR